MKKQCPTAEMQLLARELAQCLRRHNADIYFDEIIDGIIFRIDQPGISEEYYAGCALDEDFIKQHSP